jgi:TolB-like protein/Tfp pilus assembly protein PilF
MSTLWDEVKGRKIFKAAAFYAAIAWGIIQISDILLPVLRFPEWIMSSMVLVAFIGFPIALLTGWLIDIRNDRHKLINEDGQARSVSSRLTELLIIAIFGSGATLLYLNSNQHVQATIEHLPSVEQLTTAIDNQKTIAVLPFASFGNSEDDGYFADGLSEELLNVLAKNKQLRVAARTSSFQYKNKNINVKTIAEELGVQYVLEGSVRRSGDLIRVTAQLIKADEDVHIFSSTWDKDISNIFKVQDEIAQSVLETLEIKLLGKNEKQSSDIGTQNIAAFAEYSRGVADIRKRTKKDFESAIVHLNKALAIDPNYAEANAMIAQTYLLQLSYDQIKKEEEIFKLAKSNIKKALKINSELPEGHAVKGLLHWQIAAKSKDDSETNEEELQKAKYHLNKAIELNPSNAEAYMWYGTILQDEGKVEDGTQLYKKAFEIDPQAAVVGFNRGIDLARSGNYEEAMLVFNTIVKNNPNYANAYSIAGNVSYSVGQLDQAYTMYKKIAELSGDNMEWLATSNRILIPLGHFEQVQQNIDELSEHESSRVKEMLPHLQAALWVASDNLSPLKKWIATFDEETEDARELLWRSYASMSDEEWKYAITDLEKLLAFLTAQKGASKDERMVRVQLLLARSWQALGDKINSESYLSDASFNINKLLNSQWYNPNKIRYSQAALASLSNKPLEALSLLRQTIQEGFVDIWMVKVDPAFDGIKGDPTYRAIMREFDAKMRVLRLKIESKHESYFENNKVASI